ncbi:MAG: BON domain-containing protein [Bacteroidetes bacterium]|nr:BON domain-containing protein [Bacteroidota bacterium]
MKTELKIKKHINNEGQTETAVSEIRDYTGYIKTNLPPSSKRSDSDIKNAVLNVIKWNSSIDENKIKIKVRDGWVTLEGYVDWEYQKSRATYLAEDIKGVVGVNNLITVVPVITPALKEKINAAFRAQLLS